MHNMRLHGTPVRCLAAAAISVTVLSGVAAVAAGGAGGAGATAPAHDTQAVRVIIQAATTGAGQQAVEHAGGQVRTLLPIVNGVAATIPAAALAALQRSPGVRAITPDIAMHVQGTTTAAGPKSVYRSVVRADSLAKKGATGAGVTVALLDTGISPSPALDARVLPVRDDLTGQTTACENLSGEPTCADGYGHGTFLAGIIAGNGASSSGGAYMGVAPSARLVSIKVGASDGSADVSNVLAGIQWAVTFRQRYGIRILNLSLGTDSKQSWRSDPLNYAVERAWASGIAVIVSASNRGPATGSISKPADDPWVITVGAVADRGTLRLTDDRLPDFSGRGPTVEGVAKPDVVAPGAHLVSLRAVGSAIDREFTNYVNASYRRGSGTSMAAAVVSGVAAIVLSARPDYTPDRLKYALQATAHPDAGASSSAVGHGVVDAYAAALTAPPGLANQSLPRSNGLGALDASRGSVRVATSDPLGTVLSGLLTAQLLLWDPIGYTTGLWIGPTWYVTNWYTARWLSTSWLGSDWSGHNWEGCSQGSKHYGNCFYGHNWEGSVWYGAWD